MDTKWANLSTISVCLKQDEMFFRNKFDQGVSRGDAKCLFRMTKSNPDKNTMYSESELWDYGDSMYLLTHETTDVDGWSVTHYFWIRSSRNLVDIYEYLCHYKPMPTWENFVEFVKECTLVKF